MNRVELAAAGAGLKPLERARPAGPVLTAATVLFITGGNVDVISFAIGYDVTYEAPVRHGGGPAPVSALLRARQEQMAG